MRTGDVLSKLLLGLFACFLAIFFTFDLVTALLSASVPATAEPASANESATQATTIAGEGPDSLKLLIRSLQSFREASLLPAAPTPREI